MSHMLARPFVFFDLGQTLVDESDFINYFDERFLEILNGFGARIDKRNYLSVRNSVIRDRRIGHGSVIELVHEVSRLLTSPGFEDSIASKIYPEIEKVRKSFFRFAPDAPEMLAALAKMQVDMGIIANQSLDILDLLDDSGLGKYFKVKVISSDIKMAKPELQIFEYALLKAGRPASECVMVGDRLDTDICPATSLGMTTIRYTNSLFVLQEPVNDCERATYSVKSLSEIPAIVERIISQRRL